MGFECLKDKVRTAAWMENGLWEGRETDLSYCTKGDADEDQLWKEVRTKLLGSLKMKNQSRATRTVNLGKQVNTVGKGVR